MEENGQKLPRDADLRRALRALERLGCQVVRQRGSHIRIEQIGRPDLAATFVMHPSQPLKPGTLRQILRRLDIPVVDFLREY